MFDRTAPKKFSPAKRAKLAKAPTPTPIILLNLYLGVPFGVAQDMLCALFARDTVLSNVPFIPGFQTSLARVLSAVKNLVA
jgi:hypothetical protein